MVDEGYFYEVQREFARNILGRVCASRRPLGRYRRQSTGASGRLSRHQRFGERRRASSDFAIASIFPIVTFVDVPGFLPGTEQEYHGIIRHGAKLLYAYAEATVPKVTVVTRKAYGGGYIVMSSKHLRGDINFAYPTG